jgi:hypothetical protein
MNQTFWTDERIAGSLLVGSLIVLLLAVILLFASGAMSGFFAMLGGSLAQVAPYAGTFRLLILFFILGWFVQLLGTGLLARLLVHKGGEQLAFLAFTLILVATIFAVLYSAFRMSVELWAAQEAARTGSLPAVYEPLKAWTHVIFGVSERVYFLATAGFGWGILRTGLLARWVGWMAIGWSLLWLLVGLSGGVPPATPLIMPAVIGLTLLRE